MSTSESFAFSSNEMTFLKIGSFEALRCFTKSTMPPVNLKFSSTIGSGRSSLKRISRPLFRNAISRSRSIRV